MKKLYLIGNLKMNMTKSEIKPYFEDLSKVAEGTNNFVGVCVPYVYLCCAEKNLAGTNVHFGVQNMNAKDSGAYTGEVSPKMLKDFGTELVIIGHSERRQMYNETDQSVNEKVKVALSYGYTPILCFGETLEERNAEQTFDRVKLQIEEGIKGIDSKDISKIIFAYEPIWAIGTGLSATSKEAQSVISYAKDVTAGCASVGRNEIVMLYGGSLKPSNASELLSQPDIDGGLIGGACLKVEDFKSIIYASLE